MWRCLSAGRLRGGISSSVNLISSRASRRVGVRAMSSSGNSGGMVGAAAGFSAGDDKPHDLGGAEFPGLSQEDILRGEQDSMIAQIQENMIKNSSTTSIGTGDPLPEEGWFRDFITSVQVSVCGTVACNKKEMGGGLSPAVSVFLSPPCLIAFTLTARSRVPGRPGVHPRHHWSSMVGYLRCDGLLCACSAAPVQHLLFESGRPTSQAETGTGAA